MTVPQDVTYGSEQFRAWLVDLKDRALLGSCNSSYAMLRAFLQEARDRSKLEDALRLADLLPPLVRGIMLEGWHPEAAAAGERRPFLDAVKERLEPHQPPPDSIVEDVLAVLAYRTPPHVRPALATLMPPELRSMWAAAIDDASSRGAFRALEPQAPQPRDVGRPR